MLLHKVQHAMDVFPSIWCFLCVHNEGMTSLKHNQYIGVLSILPLVTQAVWPDLVRTAKQPCHPQVGVYCYMNNSRSWMCYHSSHMFCQEQTLDARLVVDGMKPPHQICTTIGNEMSCFAALANANEDTIHSNLTCYFRVWSFSGMQ